MLLLLLLLMVGRMGRHQVALSRARVMVAAAVPGAVAVHYGCHRGIVFLPVRTYGSSLAAAVSYLISPMSICR